MCAIEAVAAGSQEWGSCSGGGDRTGEVGMRALAGAGDRIGAVGMRALVGAGDRTGGR
jgi:hypothetical protein